MAVSLADAAHAADATSSVSSASFVAPPVFTWTGFYGGENGGVSFTGGSVSAPDGLWSAAFNAAGSAYNAANSSARGKFHSLLGGGDIGFNYQVASAVFGIEGDLYYRGVDTAASAIGPQRATESLAFTSDVNSHWLSTVRGRFGGAIDRVLIYATGGLALAGQNYRYGYTILEPDGQDFPLGSTAKVAAGFAFGGGLEYAINKNWTLQGEYLFADLGPSRNFSPASPSLPALGGRPGTLDETVIRAALNYKFDWGAPGGK